MIFVSPTMFTCGKRLNSFLPAFVFIATSFKVFGGSQMTASPAALVVMINDKIDLLKLAKV
jgi:hypothetical protein